jgi:hypothetical protein
MGRGWATLPGMAAAGKPLSGDEMPDGARPCDDAIMTRFAPRILAVLAAFGLALALSTSLGAASGSARDQARATAASSAYAAYAAQLKTGTVTADTVYVWSVRWLEAEKKTKTALSAAQDHLARMRSLATEVKGRVAGGLATSAEEKAAAYYVAEAEVWLADAGGTP